MNFALLLLCGLSLQTRYEGIHAASSAYRSGGAVVLQATYDALAEGNYTLVGIEDLWAVALKEGKNRFENPELWSATTPQQTGDMLGQTTIGPWQITMQNARHANNYYGISSKWDNTAVVAFLKTKPGLQAYLAADLLEAAYREHGKRSPYALQSYFWLEGYLQKKIGQGAWYNSVLAHDPTAMISTGFYAKQLLLGSRFNPDGLLYWLYVAQDHSAIQDTLRLWSDRGFPITAEDLQHCSCNPDFQNYLRQLIEN